MRPIIQRRPTSRPDRPRLAVVALLGLAGASLGACATQSLPPTQVIRYHLGTPIVRGTVATRPLTGSDAPASLEYKTYAAAVETQLLQNGYVIAAVGAKPDFYADVSFTRTNQIGPPRRSPISIGLGAGGFSGGGYRGGGVGLGGGVGFPIGGGGNAALVVTELSVTIKKSVDQSPVWEGHARTVANARANDADAQDQAAKLARAMFTGFPGESGRTIEVK